MQSQQKAGLSLSSFGFTDTQSEAEGEEIREGVERGEERSGEEKGRVKEEGKQKEEESKVYGTEMRLRVCWAVLQPGHSWIQRASVKWIFEAVMADVVRYFNGYHIWIMLSGQHCVAKVCRLSCNADAAQWNSGWD